jgi:hypothetical protein
MRLPSFRRRLAGKRRTLRGQSLVEFALVAPILLLIFAGAADFGRAFYAYVAIENAAKEGALYGSRAPHCIDDSLQGCGGANNVTWRVRSELAGQGIRNPDGTELTPGVACIAGGTPVPVSDCESGDVYEVSLTYPFRLLTPILGSIIGDLDLATSARAALLNDAAAVAPNPTLPGLSVDKYVSTAGADNGAEIQTKCQQGQDILGGGYFRSPCYDSSTTEPNDFLSLRFESGVDISYRIVVRNSGGVNLTGVTVSDSQGALPGSCFASTTIAVGASLPVCTYTRVAPAVSGSDLTAPLENVATADSAETEPVTAGATVTVLKPPARLTVEKHVSPYEDGNDGDGTPTFGTATSLTVTHRPAPQVSGGTVWFRLRVVNTGGQPATNLTVTDSRGPLTPSATCPAVPSSLAAGDFWQCRYPVTYTSTTPDFTNTVNVTADNVTPLGTHTRQATLDVNACTSGNNRTVPKLIGLTKAQATAAWIAAGFQAARLTTWTGNDADDVEAQSVAAYSCVNGNSTNMTVYRVDTP